MTCKKNFQWSVQDERVNSRSKINAEEQNGMIDAGLIALETKHKRHPKCTLTGLMDESD